MKLDKNHEVRVTVVGRKEDGTYGDCYSGFRRFRADFPNSEYRFVSSLQISGLAMSRMGSMIGMIL